MSKYFSVLLHPSASMTSLPASAALSVPASSVPSTASSSSLGVFSCFFLRFFVLALLFERGGGVSEGTMRSESAAEGADFRLRDFFLDVDRFDALEDFFGGSSLDEAVRNFAFRLLFACPAPSLVCTPSNCRQASMLASRCVMHFVLFFFEAARFCAFNSLVLMSDTAAVSRLFCAL